MLRVAWRRVAAPWEGLVVLVLVGGRARGEGPKKEKPEARKVLRKRRSSTSWWPTRADGGCGIDDGRCMACVGWGWVKGVGRSEGEKEGRARRRQAAVRVDEQARAAQLCLEWCRERVHGAAAVGE